MDTKQLVLQVIVAIIGGAIVPTIINYFANKKKSKAEATDVLTGSALKLVTGIQNELERTKKELFGLECEVAKKDEKIEQIADQVSQLKAQLADKEQRIRTLEAQLVEKDSKIRELQIALTEKNGRVDALEKRIKELEEAEQRHTQHEKERDTQ